ncbi:MAG: hypothetical protein IJN43_12710 [Ruminococcus sp.]|nr:hypothetical protein [Ruminococcus sp.]
MKKTIKAMTAVITSLSLSMGTMPISAFGYETGTIDSSELTVTFGDYKSISFNSSFMPKILANDEIEDYLLGANLDANNKAVYDAFNELVEPSLDTIIVDLPEPVTFKTKDLSTDENSDFFNEVFTACSSGMEASSFDNPWIFWLDQNNIAVTPLDFTYSKNWWSGEYTCTFKGISFVPAAYAGFESFEQIYEYKAQLEEVVENYVIEGETRAEQLRSIHDSICYFTTYDTSGRFSGSALSSLLVPGAVCEGYSKGFKILADKVGIPTVCVFGNYDPSNQVAHMWNYVQMEDGNWYAIDTTWDDYDGSYGYEIIYEYFLKGSDDFFVKHSEDADYNTTHLVYPEIVNWNYGDDIPNVKVTTATTPTTTTTTTTTVTTTESTTTTTETTTTTAKPTTTTTTTTAKPTTTTTTTTAKPTTTTTTTTAKPTTTTTTTTAKPTTTTTTTTAKPTTTTTTTTAKPTTTTTTTTAKPTTTTTTKPTTTTTKPTTTTTKPTTTTTKPTTTTTKPIEYEKGDLNHDGKVTIADLVCCAEAVLGTGKYNFSCDVSGDNRTDVYDVIIMRVLLVNKLKANISVK